MRLRWAFVMLVLAGAGAFFLLRLFPAAAPWYKTVGALLLIAGSTALLYDSRRTRDRRTTVRALALFLYGVSQFIPGTTVQLAVLIPVLLALGASLAGVPRWFFAPGRLQPPA